MLAPDQTVLSFICTDGYDPRVEKKFDELKDDDPIVYRVQLRRGLFTFARNNQQYPATTVIAVEFRKKDVEAAP
jgi:hypothetical protein